MTGPHPEVELLEFATLEEWTGWLKTHHATASEAWLRIRKRRTSLPCITIEEALDGALCYGWIDGLRRSLDEQSFRQRYSPRTRRSPWSAINRAKAEALIAAGRMAEPGFAEIEAARSSGRWNA